MKRGELRIELIIATLALVASAAASVATVVQTRVVGNQLSASVWPYLTFDTTLAPGRMTLAIDDDGLGPAIVRNVRLTVDGRPISSWRTVLPFLTPHVAGTAGRRHATRRIGLSERDVYPGSVIRPGSSLDVIDVRDPALDLAFEDALKKRIDLRVCYCSILGQCWNAALAGNDTPQSTGDCGPPGPPLVY